MRGEIQMPIDTYLGTTCIHAPPHVKESMVNHRSRLQLIIFGRRMTEHAPPETCVRAEMDGASCDAPTVNR